MGDVICGETVGSIALKKTEKEEKLLEKNEIKDSDEQAV